MIKKDLIIKTFENDFNKNKFIDFLRDLLKTYEEKTFVYNGNYIPDAYKESIRSLERVGKYSYDDKEIDLLIVTLKQGAILEQARTLQRNFIAWYLKGSRGGKLKDAALVAFVSPDSVDWRFSLVKMDYSIKETPTGKIKVKEEFTPVRRWSFLVGKNEKSHTAQSRFLPILENDKHQPTLEDLENAFNVETVTKEFFIKYRDLFVRLKLELDKIVSKDKVIKNEFTNKNINTVDFSKKLLGQIVFLYFLQKKGWFGVEKGKDWGTGPKDFIRRLFNKEFGGYQNFFNDILEPLFYEALSVDRSAASHFYSHFNCKIPFLNGGLFDPINGYDWVNTDIVLPDEIFSNTNRTKEGDIGDGILDVFDCYNFTVNEEEPLEKEVALDPELLGKIYEKLNAIRCDNFDEYLEVLKSGKSGEENKFNKEFGVYYTPREIVHYMCQESLIHYLFTELHGKVKKEDLEEFVRYAELIIEHEKTALKKSEEIKSGQIKETKYEHKLPQSIIQNAQIIDNLLAEIKICDPAVGSGAFLTGMLHEIVKLRKLLAVYLNKQINTYDIKRHCIENSLYGVDIDSGAIETCKLRFWLSLIVDEEDFHAIKPLPNLDFKVVCGDSLLGVEKTLFNKELFESLVQFKKQYFGETNLSNKKELKDKIDNTISQITNGHKEFDFEVYFYEVFREKKGFDIVIANPPYVQLQKNSGKFANLYQKAGFTTFDRTGDIYCLFYEKGINILGEKGILCFITSNKWMRAGYGEKLRNFFLQYNPKVLVDLGPGVFESATVDTNIILIQKEQKCPLGVRAVTLAKDENINIANQIAQRGVILEKLTKDAWFIGNSAEQQLKEKIERIGKPLKDWDVNIYYGIKTGLNEAFIITTEKRNEILANCRDEDERKRTEAIIKPILRGRDIKRYYYEWAGLWVIVIPAGWTKKVTQSSLIEEKAEKEIIKLLPSLMNHLLSFKEKAQKRDDQGDYWWELRHCAYYPEFEKEKVVYSEIVRNPQFYFDEEKYFVEATSFLMTGNNIKYICGLLNSLPLTFFFKQWYAGGGLGDEGYRYKKAFLEDLPIPPITPANQSTVNQIEGLVDKILAAKKQNPQADTSEWEREIDMLVYKLYDLTEEEIRIVEGEKL